MCFKYCIDHRLSSNGLDFVLPKWNFCMALYNFTLLSMSYKMLQNFSNFSALKPYNSRWRLVSIIKYRQMTECFILAESNRVLIQYSVLLPTIWCQKSTVAKAEQKARIWVKLQTKNQVMPYFERQIFPITDTLQTKRQLVNSSARQILIYNIEINLCHIRNHTSFQWHL